MDQILKTDDTELAELTLDDAVGGDSCAVSSDLKTRVKISGRKAGWFGTQTLIEKIVSNFFRTLDQYIEPCRIEKDLIWASFVQLVKKLVKYLKL